MRRRQHMNSRYNYRHQVRPGQTARQVNTWWSLWGSFHLLGSRVYQWRASGAVRAAGVAMLAVLTLALVAGCYLGLADVTSRLATHSPRRPGQTSLVGQAQSAGADPELIARRSQAVRSLPAVGHWVDTTDNTAYMTQLHANSDGIAAFTFSTPTGQQLAGNLPLVLLTDGTLAEGVGIGTGTAPASLFSVSRCLRSTLQSDTPLPIAYTFVAHISADGLAAFATLSYASILDKAGTALVCQGGQGNGVTTYQLSAGCTQSSCTDLTSLAGPSVAHHDTAVLTAEQDGSQSNWDAVYQLTSEQFTAQYQPEEFAALLNQQVKSVGTITAISAPVTEPVIEYTPEGQAYFQVQQTVKIQHNGSTKTQNLTSYYLLENGAWRFWFSQ